MKRHLGIVAAVLVIGAVASSAALANSFAVSIGGPGFGVGYSTGGYGFAYAPPPVAVAPAPYYAPPYPYYVAPRVVYAPYGRYYHGPYWRGYWRR